MKIEAKIIEEIKTDFWDDYRRVFKYEQDRLNEDLFARSTWLPAYEYAKRQVEEIFCDCIGLEVFAESYVFAFCYLIFPGFSGQRSPFYPNMKRRISYIKAAAELYGIEVPLNVFDGFDDNEDPSDPTIKLLVDIADRVSDSLGNEIMVMANEIVKEKGIPFRSKERILELKEYFKKKVPISGALSLTDILNAGWLCFNEDFWPDIELENKKQYLKELVLKSIEVFEIEELIREPG